VSRRIELTTLLAFSAGELPEEVFVDLTQHIALPVSLSKPNGGD
jgi:hypothetical protein